MDSALNKEDIQPKRNIYTEIQRKSFEHRALIPKNLNISRRSTQHTRIEKSFEVAYNCSPRSRIAKMKAARKVSESRGISNISITPDSPCCANAKKKFIFETSSLNKHEIFNKISNLYEKERANTNKILSRMSEFRKTIEHDLSLLDQLKSRGEITKRNMLTISGKKLKENMN